MFEKKTYHEVIDEIFYKVGAAFNRDDFMPDFTGRSFGALGERIEKDRGTNRNVWWRERCWRRGNCVERLLSAVQALHIETDSQAGITFKLMISES